MHVAIEGHDRKAIVTELILQYSGHLQPMQTSPVSRHQFNLNLLHQTMGIIVLQSVTLPESINNIENASIIISHSAINTAMELFNTDAQLPDRKLQQTQHRQTGESHEQISIQYEYLFVFSFQYLEEAHKNYLEMKAKLQETEVISSTRSFSAISDNLITDIAR